MVILAQTLAFGQQVQGQDPLAAFTSEQGIRGRLDIFYSTLDRYIHNSAYDWLDAINIAREQALQLGDSTSVRLYKSLEAELYFDLGEYSNSADLANSLLGTVPETDRELQHTLLDLIDRNYGALRLYDKQIELRRRKRDLGFTENISFYDIYANLGLYRKAVRDFITERKKEIDPENPYSQAEYDNQVGVLLLADNSPSRAISYFNQAQGNLKVYLNNMDIAKSRNDLRKAELLQGLIDGNIGRTYLKLNETREALPYLENSLTVLGEYRSELYRKDLAENKLALAEAYLALKNPKKALEYLKQPSDAGVLEQSIRRNRLLGSYYEGIKDFREAGKYLNEAFHLQDSLDALELALRKQQLLILVTNEEVAASRQMINEQKEALERGRAELEAQDMRINLVFISLVFTLLGFGGLVFAYLKNIKNQRLMAEQKLLIERSLVEKDSLLKEIHHRVKNNLQMVSSLLSLQSKNHKSPEVIEALEEGKSRVKAMALIHQKLYQNDDLSVIEMQGYIESLINSVQSVFNKAGHNIVVSVDAEGVELDIDRAIPIGLILNELVSNSFKYAFPNPEQEGRIYIHIRKTGEGGFFEYTDNGVGMPEDLGAGEGNSMGLRLIGRLVNQLQSFLNSDKNVEGVRFWFDFK
jgi:two-component sensor histidine kinase